MSERGAEYLIGRGDAAALVALGPRGQANENHHLAHSLDLNEIHLAFLGTGKLAVWKSEIEIRSQNELTGYGYAKDYDAIVSVEGDGGKLQFALEYERQPKAANRYPPIREAVERESQVSCLLYVVPAYSLLTYVAAFFERCPRAVYFGLLEDFRRRGFNAEVLDWRRTQRLSLSEVLGGPLKR